MTQTTDTPERIAILLDEARALRKQANELSRAKLAQKLEIPETTISNVIYKGLIHECAGLIIDCHAEALRLRERLKMLSYAALAAESGYTVNQIRVIVKNRAGSEG